jgi:hypothetical protein
MAVNAHRHRRTTKDVDFLVSVAGLAHPRHAVARGHFHQSPGRRRRFIEPATNVSFDILFSGNFRGNGKPGPIAYPDPSTVGLLIEDLLVVDLPNLVQLNLVAGRYQDFADVVNLIRENQLAEDFSIKLHESIRADYLECLEEMRCNEEYERRQDENARD